MTRLICLANSWKHGDRCIAGINPDTGQWIRPGEHFNFDNLQDALFVTPPSLAVIKTRYLSVMAALRSKIEILPSSGISFGNPK